MRISDWSSDVCSSDLKAPQLVQPLRVVDEEARLLTVGLGEVLCRDRQRFGDAFADGDAGHNDDELRPAIAAVQPEPRLSISIGFASSVLHLHLYFNLPDPRLFLSFFFRFGPPLPLLFPVSLSF